ncbi:hypothetical protein BSU04_15260 [Caballeronia sordidicola]|uniref:Uncharacterized protein n=1 Tax=Caballeronia sordidicola TaxID=196367 RepID=A0A226X4C2_CABSO|nr:hypothetical protein BSU04_15260 [Caballeronia sordidicola]
MRAEQATELLASCVHIVQQLLVRDDTLDFQCCRTSGRVADVRVPMLEETGAVDDGVSGAVRLRRQREEAR